VQLKKNKNKGTKLAAVYETYAATVFKHDIKWCRCHMLPSDILPGQRPGSLTWNEGFRLYSQQYIKNHSDSTRPAPKQNPASLTPLAKNMTMSALLYYFEGPLTMATVFYDILFDILYIVLYFYFSILKYFQY
jgi:hypothetical protein